MKTALRSSMKSGANSLVGAACGSRVGFFVCLTRGLAYGSANSAGKPAFGRVAKAALLAVCAAVMVVGNLAQAQVRHGAPGRTFAPAGGPYFAGAGYRGGPSYYRSGPGYYRGGGWGPGWFVGGLGLGIGLAAASTYYAPGYYAPGYYGSGFYGSGYYGSGYYNSGPVYYAPPVVSTTAVPADPGYVISGAPIDDRASSRADQPVHEPHPAAGNEPIFYPRNGQSARQVEEDRQECNRWATTQQSAMSDRTVFQRATLACMDGRGYTVR